MSQSYGKLIVLAAVFGFSLAYGVSRQSEAAQLWKKGYDLVLERQFDDARAVFADLQARYSRSKYVDDSAFWLCKIVSESREGDEKSFACFKEFVGKYRRSKYVDDAKSEMIVIGRRLVDQGQSQYADEIDSLTQDQDEEIALTALKALANSGDPTVLSTVMEIYQGHPSERIRLHSARVLEDFDVPEAVDHLIAIARQDSSTRVRARALRSLGDKGADARVISFLKEVVSSEAAPELRAQALRTLGDIEDPDLIPYLTDLAVQADGPIAMAAVRSIGDIGGSAALQAFQTIYRQSGSADVRRRSLRGMADDAGNASLPFLEEVAGKGPDSESRRAALRVIGDIETPEALQVLTRLVSQSQDSEVRRAAMRAIADAGGEASVAYLGKILEEDSDPSVRRSAARALGDTESDLAVPFLKNSAFSDPVTDVRRAAARALGEIGTSAARNALVELVRRQRN